MQRKIFFVLGGLIIVGLGAFVFLARPTKAPSSAPVVSETTPSADSVPVGATYRIVPEESRATFSIKEVLRGKPFTAVGTTTAIEGSIQFDAVNPAASKRFGEIRVNARTFVTDSPQRDNAIRRFILKTESDANEWITFTPTTVTGLPTRGLDGQPMQLTMTGPLTIAGVTKDTTFTATAQVVGNRLQGTATATVQRSDFGLVVPSLPFLAGVEEAVVIDIALVAELAE